MINVLGTLRVVFFWLLLHLSFWSEGRQSGIIMPKMKNYM